MVNPFKKLVIWIGLSILMMILLVIGLFLGNAIFPSDLMDQTAEPDNAGTLLLFISSALNCLVILIILYNSKVKGWRLVISLFLVIFGIQYFMSQIETLWFNESVDFPIKGIFALVSGGLFMTFFISLIATLLTGKFKLAPEQGLTFTIKNKASLFKKILILSIAIWPIVYFMAGYYIAWQFQDVRVFYSGKAEIEPFTSVMVANFKSGLFFFQLFRGLIWVLIAMLAFSIIKGSWIHKGVMLGLLFSVIGCSQLLLPNPFMPENVRMVHLLETSTSMFLWALIIAWYLQREFSD